MRQPTTILILFALSVLCVVPSAAQETPWRWGVWLGGAIATPSTDVRELPGAPSCLGENGRLDDVTGLALTFGGDIGWRPSMSSTIEFAARIGAALSTTSFVTQERIGEASDAQGTLQDVVVEYQSDVRNITLRVEPAVRWYMHEPIVVSLGTVVAIPLTTSFEQREQLVAPSQATYGDGTSERAIASGPLDDYARGWFGLSAGVAVDIPIAQRLTIRPEIGGVLALGSPLRDVDWHPHEVRASIALIFGGLGETTPIMPYGDGD